MKIESKVVDPVVDEWLKDFYPIMLGSIIFDHYSINTDTAFFELKGKKEDFEQELLHLEKFLQVKLSTPRLLIGIIQLAQSNLPKESKKDGKEKSVSK